jgi:hypothetical protein
MIKTAIFYIVMLVLTALVGFTGCGQDKVVSGTEQAAVLAYSEAIMDNLFAGLTANDYAVFSRDFDTDMQKNIPATDFAAWKQDLDNQLGNHLSRQVDQVTQSGEFYVVVYQAKFEQAEPVIVRVAFHAVEPHLISHLWFDSEKLQQK